MQRAFTKMHGLGNDFVVVDATTAPFEADPAAIRTLADRRRGVGCDQVLVLDPPPAGGSADFGYRIYNADGSESGQCGNGARCLARFIAEQGLSDRARLRVATRGSVLTLERLDDGRVRVDMGVPRLDPAEVPFDAAARAPRYALALGGEGSVEVGVVNLGNPHAVLAVPDVAAAAVEAIGRALQAHPAFPESVNVGFLQVEDERHARLRVYERGVGETPACGSGACAAMVVGRLWGKLAPAVTMALPGGTLELEWDGEGTPVRMTGPAVTVYHGEIELPDGPAARGAAA